MAAPLPSPAPVRAIVPLRSLRGAKRRLAPSLPDHQRRELVAWMAQRVLAALSAAETVARTVVVAGDAEAAALAEAAGAQALRVPARGLDHALSTADALAPEPPASLVVPADLPLARSGEVDRLCRALEGHGPGVALVATRDGGTGALLRRPGRVIATAFGAGSAQRHRDRAAAQGIPVRTLDLPGLAHDVDVPEDLAVVAKAHAGPLPWAATPAGRGPARDATH